MGKLLAVFGPVIIIGILLSWKYGKSKSITYTEFPDIDTPKDRMIGEVIWLIGIPTAFIGRAILWMMYRDQSKFVDNIGKDYLNFWISYFIYSTAIIIVIGIISRLLFVELEFLNNASTIW